ncbi:MAG: dGTPase [Aeromonas sp.]
MTAFVAVAVDSAALTTRYGQLLPARRTYLAAAVSESQLAGEPGAELTAALAASEADRLIVVQAAPVRRLQQKTQVFPLDVKASVRSRLTHSLEAQAIGRQLVRQSLAAWHAQGVTLPPDLAQLLQNGVETACLLHDIGNPPFGHFGEQVIGQWFGQQIDALYHEALAKAPSAQWPHLRADLLAFDGNAQSLRLLHCLQGLNLTHGLLAALCKYPPAATASGDQLRGSWPAHCCVFFSERAWLTELLSGLDLAPGRRHPLVYLVEAADDIAYSLADLEDALDRRIFSERELWAALTACDTHDALPSWPAAALACGGRFYPRLRDELRAQLMAEAVTVFSQQQSAMLRGDYPWALLDGDSRAAHLLTLLKTVARREVFMRPEVEALELEGYAALRGVLDGYRPLLAMPAAEFAALLAGRASAEHFFARRLLHRLSARHVAAYQQAVAVPDQRFVCAHEQAWYYRVRLLQDYVSGMTDTYAREEYRQLGGL